MSHPCDFGMCDNSNCEDCLPEPAAVPSILPQEREEEKAKHFPSLNSAQREFVMSGTTEEEWNEMFPKEE